MKVRPRKMVVNPFVSEAQRRACYAADDPNWDCSEWDKETKKDGKQPVANAKPKKKGKNPLRIDPTRTAMMRRQATARVRKAFAILKGKLRKLLIDEDAFGLKERKPFAVNEWNPDQPRDEAGRFASMAAGAISAIHKGESWVKDKVKENFAKLPEPVQAVVSAGLKTAFAGWTASQALAERVAKEKGLTDEKAATLRGALAAADLIAFKPAAMAAPFLPGGGAITAAMWAVPPVTGAYLLYSTATSPVATFKAASGLVKEALGKVKEKIHGSGPFVTENNQVVLHALERAGYSDWWLALFCSAGAETGSVLASIDLANTLFRRNPTANAYGRFSFHSTPQQIKAFQAWLRQQFAQHIISEQDKDVWRAYAEAGWKKGAGRAFDDVRQNELKKKRPELFTPEAQAQGMAFYAGTRSEFLSSAFNQPVSQERIEVLASRTFDDLKNVTDDMATRMSRTLTDGLARGDSPYDVAADLADDLDISRGRAEVIARTELIRAHAEGQLDGMEKLGVKQVGVMVEWLATDDDRVCAECESMEGTILSIDEARGEIPAHPNCLLPDNLVEGRFSAALKSFYTGEVVELCTAQGTRATLTVNHPVLTKNGFVRAGDIHKGNYLAHNSGKFGGIVNSDVQHRPITIQQVFNSFAANAVKKSVSGFDFQGDEKFMVGKVQVVRPNPFFFERFAHHRQHFLNFDFVPAGDRSVRGADLPLPLFRGHAGPLVNLGFALPTGLNAVPNQPAFYPAPANTKGLRKCKHGFPLQKPSADFRLVNKNPVPCQYFGFGSQLDIGLPEPVRQGVTFDTDLFGQLQHRFTSQVSLDKVVKIRRFHYSGPVYDLESPVGYFTAGIGGAATVIIKNCRCAWIPANVGEDEDDDS